METLQNTKEKNVSPHPSSTIAWWYIHQGSSKSLQQILAVHTQKKTPGPTPISAETGFLGSGGSPASAFLKGTPGDSDDDFLLEL